MFIPKSRFVPHWTKDINWTYRRRSEEVLNVYWMSYVHLIYVLCPGVRNCRSNELVVPWKICLLKIPVKLLGKNFGGAIYRSVAIVTHEALSVSQKLLKKKLQFSKYLFMTAPKIIFFTFVQPQFSWKFHKFPS